MLIHVEGVDLCGKSTLIDKMSRLFKNIMILTTPKDYLPRDDKIESRKRIWDFYLKRLNEVDKLLEDYPDATIVLDRFFFSELVYGKVIRGYDSKDMYDLQQQVYNKIKEIDDKYGYGLIYLSDDTESIRQRYLDKGDDYIKDKKHYHNLKVEYNKLIKDWGMGHKVIRVNVFKENDYWNRIIDNLFLSNYVYTRDGKR